MPKTAVLLGLTKNQILVKVNVHNTTPVGAAVRLEIRLGGRLVSVFDGQQVPDGVEVATTVRPTVLETVEVLPLVNGLDRSARTDLAVRLV